MCSALATSANPGSSYADLIEAEPNMICWRFSLWFLRISKSDSREGLWSIKGFISFDMLTVPTSMILEELSD